MNYERNIFLERKSFKPLHNYEEDHIINEEGIVIRIIDNKILPQSISNQGYLRVTLRKGSEWIKETIHQLKARTFIPNPQNYPCINHIDGNKLNNDLDNLEWCTYKQNNKHARDNKLNNNIGENHFNSKLSNVQVNDIKEMYKSQRYTQKEISELFQVHQVHISRIINEKRRKSL